MFGFTISLGSIWKNTVLCFHISQTVHLPLAFLTYLSSLFPLLKIFQKKNNKKKQQEQVTKKFLEWKEVHVGMEPSKTAKQDGKDTTIHSHHSYILWHFGNYTHHKTLYMHLAYSHPLNQQGTQYSSLHSFPYKIQSISATFSSNKISQHNLTL